MFSVYQSPSETGHWGKISEDQRFKESVLRSRRDTSGPGFRRHSKHKTRNYTPDSQSGPQLAKGLRGRVGLGRFSGMSTITAIMEPDADGTLHLPLPEELKSAKVKVVATLEAAEKEADRKPSMPKPDFAAIRQRLWGPDLVRRKLSAEDSAFIRDRGDR